MSKNPLYEIKHKQPGYDNQQRRLLTKLLPELLELESLLERGRQYVHSEILGAITVDEIKLPIHAVTLGSSDPKAPVLLLTGGVHGLERVGSHVVLAFLQTLIERLRWDQTLSAKLEKLRIVFIPLVNPGGMMKGTRSNPQGVDLMRNAPIEALDSTPFLAGGQRISSSLPWYRGDKNKMEDENNFLIHYIRKKIFSSPFALVLDCHSGFGFHDRIWFPYAYRKQPIRNVEDIFSLKLLLDQTFPHHHYHFEPQSKHYLTHGDIWDYAFKLSKSESSGKFIPLTLEMGSWRWVRKNPMQIFSMLGLFNPVIPHRVSRTKRQHLTFLDFLTRAAYSYKNWLPNEENRDSIAQAAKTHWYSRGF